MKYLYPYECEKKGLSSPGELQAAIDSNRREGRRPGYSNSLYRFSSSPSASAPHLLSPPKMHLPAMGHNGLQATPSTALKKASGVQSFLRDYRSCLREYKPHLISLISLNNLFRQKENIARHLKHLMYLHNLVVRQSHILIATFRSFIDGSIGLKNLNVNASIHQNELEPKAFSMRVM